MYYADKLGVEAGFLCVIVLWNVRPKRAAGFFSGITILRDETILRPILAIAMVGFGGQFLVDLWSDRLHLVAATTQDVKRFLLFVALPLMSWLALDGCAVLVDRIKSRLGPNDITASAKPPLPQPKPASIVDWRRIALRKPSGKVLIVTVTFILVLGVMISRIVQLGALPGIVLGFEIPPGTSLDTAVKQLSRKGFTCSPSAPGNSDASDTRISCRKSLSTLNAETGSRVYQVDLHLINGTVAQAKFLVCGKSGRPCPGD